jgi:hypothetical protein
MVAVSEFAAILTVAAQQTITVETFRMFVAAFNLHDLALG